MRTVTSFFIIVLLVMAESKCNELGNWTYDKNDMPVFNYTGVLPFSAVRPDGGEVKLPEDPWFLLGNYRITLFAHISGKIQILTGERAWGRVNFNGINSGGNSAVLTIDNDDYSLLGLESEAIKISTKKKFGIGYASYNYQLDKNITCSRSIHVKPSKNLKDGESAYLLIIHIKNNGSTSRSVSYKELYTARYEMNQLQHLSNEQKPLLYRSNVVIKNEKLISAEYSTESNDLFLFGKKEERALYDGYPPQFYVSLQTENGEVLESLDKGGNDAIGFKINLNLKPGEEKTVVAVVGFSFEESEIESSVKALINNSSKSMNSDGGVFIKDWKDVLPLFENERDPVLHREMIWNAYCLESMATYKAYYDEVMIPQGTAYDYDWGVHGSSRDHLQHGLPTCYYNPELSKSILRFIMKRMRPTGEIMLAEAGYGHNTHSNYYASDQQLYFFYLLGEYLRITKDYNFLFERVKYYPSTSTIETTVYEHFEKCFTFLRDDIRRGEHGLIRLLNADWNDMTYHLMSLPYNLTYHTAESHMNTAMALVFLDEIWKPFDFFVISNDIDEENLRIAKLSASIEKYRDELLKAYLADWNGNEFPRRMYINDTLVFGEDQMFLEPQGFTLQIRELDNERKIALYKKIKAALLNGEKIGARQQENPKEYPILIAGSRENGGFWWALNGPLVIGVNTFDKEEAFRLLQNMTFENISRNFPDYWSGYWSAPDNIDSSLIPTEGLPDQAHNWAETPVYCAHAHAWPLYCYYKLTQQ